MWGTAIAHVYESDTIPCISVHYLFVLPGRRGRTHGRINRCAHIIHHIGDQVPAMEITPPGNPTSRSVPLFTKNHMDTPAHAWNFRMGVHNHAPYGASLSAFPGTSRHHPGGQGDKGTYVMDDHEREPCAEDGENRDPAVADPHIPPPRPQNHRSKKESLHPDVQGNRRYNAGHQRIEFHSSDEQDPGRGDDIEE